MKVTIKNDHDIAHYYDVEALGMNSYMIEILHLNGTSEHIAREKNTEIITY